MTRQEFEKYLKALVRDHKPGLSLVYGQFGINEVPTAENLVLGYVKYGEKFANAIESQISPYENTLGSVLKDVFQIGVAAITGVAAAKNLNKPTPKPSDDAQPKSDKIFGISKVIFFSAASMVTLLIIYIIITKKQ